VPWQLADFQVFTPQGPFAVTEPGAAAAAVLRLPAVPGGQIWRLERISVQVAYDPAADLQPITVAIFDQAPELLTVAADQTVIEPPVTYPVVAPRVAYDVADQSAPISVREGNQATLVFSWPAQTIGNTIACARIQVEIYQGVAGQPTPVAGSSPPPAIPSSL
jgi:hypothetical protein